jgi:hypothetical protein
VIFGGVRRKNKVDEENPVIAIENTIRPCLCDLDSQPPLQKYLRLRKYLENLIIGP